MHETSTCLVFKVTAQSNIKTCLVFDVTVKTNIKTCRGNDLYNKVGKWTAWHDKEDKNISDKNEETWKQWRYHW